MSLPTKPQSRVENYLGVIVGQESAVLPQNPQSRVEDYLDYIARNGAKGTVKNAYFFNNKMWEDAAHTIEITPEEGKIYLAENQHKLYVYQSGAYIAISGSNQSGATVFATYQAMVNYVNYIGREELSVGSNVYILDVGVPDLWVAVAETTSIEYNFVSDEQFLADMKADGHVKVGFYLIAQLESGVDLADYYNKTQTNEKFVSKTGEDFTNVKQSIDELKKLNPYHIKPAVETYDDLPLTGNEAGDVRVTNDDQKRWYWDGDEWQRFLAYNVVDYAVTYLDGTTGTIHNVEAEV